jgi:peptide/nickel transport system substrate-binding protein
MHHWSRRRTAFYLVGWLLFILGTGLAQDEKILVIGHAETTDAYDPAHAFSPTSGIVNHVTYETLVTFPAGDASEILPELAATWTISEDGLSYTFTLNADATFADGSPVEASDVVFSLNRLKNVKAQPSFLTDPIASVTATDAQTVTIILTAARPSFLSELANSAFSVSNADVVKASGGTDAADAAGSDTALETLNQVSAGSGPYLLESWSPQEQTVLVRNPNYWGEQPYFDRVVIANIPEAATQKVALESGEIDLATDLSADQLTDLEGDEAITISSGLSNWTHFILMNRDKVIGGPVSDPRVAEAVRLALDYGGYRDLWAGSTTPGTNMWVGLAGAYGEDKSLERNLERAKELLAEAGYADGFDITLDYPDMTFGGVNLSTNAQKIQADLAEIGIRVELAPAEVQISLEGYRSGTQGFAYWFWGPDKLDPVDFLEFLPGGKVATERAMWSPEMVDQSILDLIAQAKVETDPAKRSEIFIQLQDFAQANSAFAPFSVPAVQTAYRSNIQGYVRHPQWDFDIALLSRTE